MVVQPNLKIAQFAVLNCVMLFNRAFVSLDLDMRPFVSPRLICLLHAFFSSLSPSVKTGLPGAFPSERAQLETAGPRARNSEPYCAKHRRETTDQLPHSGPWCAEIKMCDCVLCVVYNLPRKLSLCFQMQELANEKIRSQELSNQADELTQKLEKSESNQKLSLSFQMQELANEKIRSRELFKQADELTQKLEQSDSNLKLAIASAQKQSEQSAVEPKPSARVTEASEPDAQTLPHAVAQHVSAQSRQPSVDVPEVGPQISREAELAGGRLSRDHSPCSTELNERLIDVEREVCMCINMKTKQKLMFNFSSLNECTLC